VNTPPLVPSGAQAILGYPDAETTRALARAFAASVSGFLR
jgi:hypothetical protein